MIGIQDFRNASDSEILKEMSDLLNQPAADVCDFLSAVSFYQLELTRRAVTRPRESSPDRNTHVVSPAPSERSPDKTETLTAWLKSFLRGA